MRNQVGEILEHTKSCFVNEHPGGIFHPGEEAPEAGQTSGESASGSNEQAIGEDRESEEPEPAEGEMSQEPKSEGVDQQQWAPEQVLRNIRTIHSNLGHPSNRVLCRMLKEAGASPEIIQAAGKLECPQCAQRGHALPHRTAQVPQATRKWEIVSVDTFWWHSPHKDEKGNPVEHVLGVSFRDEASDYHVATVIRSGFKTQRVMSAAEFREAFSRDWLRVLPKPQNLRFDDEGAFRDSQLISWLEGQAIRLSVIAGEAAWQVGKHSRHLEVLKENMSILSLEVGPEVKAQELLACSLAAKNEMHQVSGYRANQWCPGQERDRVQSYAQHGNHLPTQSSRELESFEASIQRAEAARRNFLRADNRRRVLRAARSEKFEPGQLAYYYRKGRSAAKNEPGWHGPARVVAIENQGSDERNQTNGSVIWVIHATVLYRCAPEQLRKVPQGMTELYHELHGNESPLSDVQRAGHQANYRDISGDLAAEPVDSEIHDVEPGSGNVFPRPSARVFGKQPPRHAMAVPNKTELIKELTAQANQQAETENEDKCRQERERCLSLQLEELGAEKMKSGKYLNKTVEAAYKDSRYIVWLLNHQPNNLSFLNLMVYAERRGKNMKASGNGPSSGEMPVDGGEKRVTPSIGNLDQLMTHVLQLQEDNRLLQMSACAPEQAYQQNHEMLYQSPGQQRRPEREDRVGGPPEPSRRDNSCSDQMSRSRSRTPHGSRHEERRSVMFEDQVEVLEYPTEDVGNALGRAVETAELCPEKSENTTHIKTGCFEWHRHEANQHSDAESSRVDERTKREQPNSSKWPQKNPFSSGPKLDYSSYCCSALREKASVRNSVECSGPGCSQDQGRGSVSVGSQ